MPSSENVIPLPATERILFQYVGKRAQEVDEASARAMLGRPGYYPDLDAAFARMRAGEKLPIAGAWYWIEQAAPKRGTERAGKSRGRSPVLSDDDEAMSLETK